MVREELHAEDVVELADAVQLYSFGVVNVEPLLLSHCIHVLTVEPPSGTVHRMSDINILSGVFVVVCLTFERLTSHR